MINQQTYGGRNRVEKRMIRSTIGRKKQKPVRNELALSGWQDSNLRPPRPKRGAMTGLRYTPFIPYWEDKSK